MSGRIVVLISGSGTNMEALADACAAGEVPGEIVAVLADRDCLGLRAAEKRELPSEVVDFKGFDTREEWSDALCDAIARHEPDLVVNAGFMRIVSPSCVDRFSGKWINLHPSLLPAFPGAHAVRDALDHGVRVTGTTVHFVASEVDTGPIISQEAVRIEQNDTEDSLHERIKNVEHRLLPHACRLVLDGKVRIQDGKVIVDQG
ncbi:MAG: phosphoribosylglycinamide formyltransferase [Actinobacteria bacterium]|nr:phosphoribosylglycinamide formyltransferase [Actinomycetota bacterium]